ncbi:hypothetical protein AB0E01_40485 [Nocardia vinacea]|uniref:hypothetical protein n=1 Tax=Nocardia vinacea TaxID=96468 RepID=UPI00340BA84B
MTSRAALRRYWCRDGRTQHRRGQAGGGARRRQSRHPRHAVEEGRRIYANIQRFRVYGLSGGAAEIAVMLLGPLLGLTLPLLPAQILWINLLTHGRPAVSPRIRTRRRARPQTESILGAGLWQRVVRIGEAEGRQSDHDDQVCGGQGNNSGQAE